MIIAASQVKHILGIDAQGHNLYELLGSILTYLGETNFITMVIGISSTAFLFWVRKGLKPLLLSFGLAPRSADICAKTGPVAAVAVTTFVTWLFALNQYGVKVGG